MGAGFALMNDVTVLQASQGLASYVQSGSVVIGHDHRMNSQRFARITAVAFLNAGFTVYYLSESLRDRGMVPTPFVPFAIGHYGASCGVMITASHNPALDNGYKVYASNGCQIIPPMDAEISASIMNNLEPAPRAWDMKVLGEAEIDGRLVYVKEEVMTAYLDHLKCLVKHQVNIPFVYTPMHGVGLETFQYAVRLLAVDHVDAVKEQAQPDPYFSTVKFPNPEEKGALTLAMAAADAKGVALVIANDPDADRFSAAVKVGTVWRQLTGNELGFLLADYMIKRIQTPMDKVYVLNSTVSSQMIRSVANKLGCHYSDTLTGFKWIGNKAMELESKGYNVVFAFEEAIGFMFPGVHDKDGIATALVFLQMVQEWTDAGTNALEVLQRGFEQYGYFKEHNSYYHVHDPSYTAVVFEQIRKSYEDYPRRIGEFAVDYWRDLTTGYQLARETPDLPVDPSSQMITGRLIRGGDEVRFTMRGSGTEPKLKVYVEAQSSSEFEADKLATEVWNLLKSQYFGPGTGLREA